MVPAKKNYLVSFIRPNPDLYGNIYLVVYYNLRDTVMMHFLKTVINSRNGPSIYVMRT